MTAPAQHDSPEQALQDLQARLGHVFQDPTLLLQALTHRSHSTGHNERLEFLGDGLLDLVAAECLFRQFPDADEGELSRMRSHLVRQDALAQIGIHLKLGELVKLGDGERRSGGASRPSLLADAVEALFGAVYLDAGFEAGRRVVQQALGPMLAKADQSVLGKDAKTRLQEWLQARHHALPVYQVVQEGGTARTPDFIIECTIAQPACRTRGQGTSRRIAEQQAADAAFERLSRSEAQTASSDKDLTE